MDDDDGRKYPCHDQDHDERGGVQESHRRLHVIPARKALTCCRPAGRSFHLPRADSFSHYTLDASDGTLAFGPVVAQPDGQPRGFGAVPEQGAAIRFTRYRHGVATSRINHLLATHTNPAEALTLGFHRALLASSIFLLASAVIALRITNTRGEEQRY